MNKAQTHPEIREAVRKLCTRFPGPYWRALDRERAYPTEFVKALTDAGWLSILIPEEYGGAGLGISAACAVLEEIHRSGCNGAACHAQMYTMGTLLRHGSDAQKQKYLPKIASGELRLQAFGVTEPTSGTDTTRIQTFAKRQGDRYVVNGSKIWISRAEHSDLMVLLCRTSPRDDAGKISDGMSVLLVDMREAKGKGLTIKPVRTMLNHATTELFFDNLEVPAENLLGELNRGVKVLMSGLDYERIVACAGSLGIMQAALDLALPYTRERKQFGQPIAEFQLVQAMLADSRAELYAARCMVLDAARQRDEGKPIATEAACCKLFASEACGRIADRAVQIFGGAGYVADSGIERFYRDVRLFRIYEGTTQIQQIVIARQMVRELQMGLA